jgi:hypothetical protein
VKPERSVEMSIEMSGEVRECVSVNLNEALLHIAFF